MVRGERGARPVEHLCSHTCDLSFLDGEGDDQAEGPQHRFHPIGGADGVIGSLNREGPNSQRGDVVSQDPVTSDLLLSSWLHTPLREALLQ